jgi:hypothetical protein
MECLFGHKYYFNALLGLKPNSIILLLYSNIAEGNKIELLGYKPIRAEGYKNKFGL